MNESEYRNVHATKTAGKSYRTGEFRDRPCDAKRFAREGAMSCHGPTTAELNAGSAGDWSRCQGHTGRHRARADLDRIYSQLAAAEVISIFCLPMQGEESHPVPSSPKRSFEKYVGIERQGYVVHRAEGTSVMRPGSAKSLPGRARR